MEYLTPGATAAQQGNILCCQCGTPIQPNPANMCVACIRTQVDITEGIPKQATIYFCKSCERYLNPPAQWVQCSLESRELLALCLKRLKNLNRVRLVEAGFVWTEPHSRRIKVKVTIQKEVLCGAILQQVFVVEFQVHTQMCEDCHHNEAKDYWRAIVQIRQKTDHKKTFYYLEQLILRHRMHLNTTGIKPKHDGLDFFYATKQDARKLVDFLVSVVSCRYITSQQLISHDTHNNTYTYKHTFSVEIVPICKDNIVCLPAKLAQSLGGIGQICICSRVTEHIHLIDPNSNQVADISSQQYWRDPFGSICGPKQLQEYVVMNVEFVGDESRFKFAGQGATSKKHVLADVWIVKSADLGMTENYSHCRSHLGHLLNVGDTVLAFDLANSNVNDSNFEKLNLAKQPDVVIVKKLYADKAVRNRKRKWKLKHLSADAEYAGDSNERDYTDFLEDLEEDPMYRQKVNIYMDKEKIAVDTDETDDEGIPRITLQEMLDDLHISEDATGEEGGQMLE